MRVLQTSLRSSATSARTIFYLHLIDAARDRVRVSIARSIESQGEGAIQDEKTEPGAYNVIFGTVYDLKIAPFFSTLPGVEQT